MKKTVLRIYTAIFFVALFLVFGFLAILIPSTSKAFYKKEFQKNNTLYKVQTQAKYLGDEEKKYIENLSDEELVSLMIHTVKYCLYLEKDLNPTIDGKRLELFLETDQNTPYGVENEYKHMAEVKVVFGKGLLIVLASVLIIIVGIFLFVKNKDLTKDNMKKIPFFTLAVCLVLLLTVGVVCLINFDQAFTTFHNIFFPNGNWTFSRGIMIKLIGDIFTGIVPFIAVIWLFLIALTITFTIIYNKSKSRG